MFIRNPEIINKSFVILCTDEEKEFLASKGFFPISYDEEFWYFIRTDYILHELLNHREEEENGE